MTFISFILFILGFFLILKGADVLVEGSSSVAKKFKISSIVIGLTIVAFGTSAPEFIVSILAAYSGNIDIAISNVLGSNIANTLLILGVSAAIYPIAAKKDTVLKEIPFSILAATLVGVMANDIFFDHRNFTEISRIDGLILLFFMIIFLYYIFGITKIKEGFFEGNEIKEHSNLKSIVFIVLGLLGLGIGGKFIVDGAVEIANYFKISQSLIGLTIIAVGTSLPELATSAVAAYKKQKDIAIGNVVGSNIFNIFWVLGMSAVIHPLSFNPQANFDVLFTIFSSFILFLMMHIGKKHVIERWQGIFLVTIYICYIAFLIITN